MTMAVDIKTFLEMLEEAAKSGSSINVTEIDVCLCFKMKTGEYNNEETRKECLVAIFTKHLSLLPNELRLTLTSYENVDYAVVLSLVECLRHGNYPSGLVINFPHGAILSKELVWSLHADHRESINKCVDAITGVFEQGNCHKPITLILPSFPKRFFELLDDGKCPEGIQYFITNADKGQDYIQAKLKDFEKGNSSCLDLASLFSPHNSKASRYLASLLKDSKIKKKVTLYLYAENGDRASRILSKPIQNGLLPAYFTLYISGKFSGFGVKQIGNALENACQQNKLAPRIEISLNNCNQYLSRPERKIRRILNLHNFIHTLYLLVALRQCNRPESGKLAMLPSDILNLIYQQIFLSYQPIFADKHTMVAANKLTFFKKKLIRHEVNQNQEILLRNLFTLFNSIETARPAEKMLPTVKYN